MSPPTMPTSPTRPDFRLLRNALLANAVFSILSGVTLAGLALPTAKLVGNDIPSALVLGIGIALVPFGALAAWVATRRHPPTHLALAISVGDLSWVVASLAVVIVAHDRLTSAGFGLVITIALAVLAFAIGQLRGITRVYRPLGAAPGNIRVCLDIETAGDADLVWRHVADLGAIARFAPMLATSAMRDHATPGVDAVRECSDRQGRNWSERCVRFEAERRELEMEFLADEPGFPFPFSALRGGWHVRPAAGGVAVQIWWEGTLKNPRLAAVIPPLLGWQAQRQFAGVVRRMAGHGQEGSASAAPRLAIVPC